LHVFYQIVHTKLVWASAYQHIIFYFVKFQGCLIMPNLIHVAPRNWWAFWIWGSAGCYCQSSVFSEVLFVEVCCTTFFAPWCSMCFSAKTTCVSMVCSKIHQMCVSSVALTYFLEPLPSPKAASKVSKWSKHPNPARTPLQHRSWVHLKWTSGNSAPPKGWDFVHSLKIGAGFRWPMHSTVWNISCDEMMSQWWFRGDFMGKKGELMGFPWCLNDIMVDSVDLQWLTEWIGWCGADQHPWDQPWRGWNVNWDHSMGVLHITLWICQNSYWKWWFSIAMLVYQRVRGMGFKFA